MKIIHIESGLGNQMLSYCEYLAMKKMNPEDEVYIETFIYDVPECNDVICQWFGYELDRIFHLNAPNIKQRLSDQELNTVMSEIKSTEFWLHNWNWPVYFQQAFTKVGFDLQNMRGDFEAEGHSIVAVDVNRKKTLKDILSKTDLYQYFKRLSNIRHYQKLAKTYSNKDIHFYKSDEDELTGQRLTFKNINSGIELIEDDIRKAFTFPPITDERNHKGIELIKSCNAVAIHARRGDMLSFNYPLYRFGYFKKCVRFIRSKVESPVFFIFCDPGSVQWAKDNAKIFDLDFNRDEVHFVDWNKGEDSFRDMQLMAACKHQVITQSSFGWWGAWLNTYPDKITCSPSAIINTTHHF